MHAKRTRRIHRERRALAHTRTHSNANTESRFTATSFALLFIYYCYSYCYYYDCLLYCISLFLLPSTPSTQQHHSSAIRTSKMRPFYQHRHYLITEHRPLSHSRTQPHTHKQTLSITQFAVISNLKYGNGRCICARSSFKTTTPSAMNPFRKRHTDDKMCQIARVVVVCVCCHCCCSFRRVQSIYWRIWRMCWFGSVFHATATDPLRLSLVGASNQKLERTRLHFCQSFGCDGFVFRMPKHERTISFFFLSLTKWIYWLVLGEPTWIYGRLT